MEMSAAAVEVADFVGLELQAIDHPRLAYLWLFLLVVLLFALGVGFGQFFFGGIAKDHHQTGTVGRPGEVIDILRGVGEALRFTTGAVQEPDLRLLLIAGRKKGEVLAVGTPTRVRGGDAFGRQRDGVATVGGLGPDALFGLVFLQKESLYRVG